MVRHFVIGLGEVGRAISNVLYAPGYDATQEWEDVTAEILHICFPYSENFITQVQEYEKRVGSRITVIHSTVPIGTTRAIGAHAVHSPVRGVHPNLERGIVVFPKWFGGQFALEVSRDFVTVGCTVRVFDEPEVCEAMKLWDTTQYGMMIMLEKEIYAYCVEHNLPFDQIYTHANEEYNAGYTYLDKKNVCRPVLTHVDGPIGGHCVVSNAALLDFGLSKLISTYGKEEKTRTA